jgi:hypothetical protein
MSASPPPTLEATPQGYSLAAYYKPWPKQTAFHVSPAKYRLEVGSYGSGKSRPLLWEGIFHALEYPGSESIILRRTIPDLKRTVISMFQRDVPREVYHRYNESDHIVYFHPVEKTDAQGRLVLGPDGQPELLQSKLYFASCERDKDVNKYLSTEFVYIGFEELGEFSFFVWNALSERNRCPIPGSRACMAAATNPFGVGWPWIRKLWVKHLPVAGTDPAKFRPEDYELIHSTVDDNPIYSRDREYMDRLEASPNREVVRWGKLDARSGNYFDNWQEHHMAAKEDFIFQPWQPVWVGWDYGYSHYAAILFFTKAILKPRTPSEKPHFVNVTIKELVLHECSPPVQTRALIDCIPRDKDGGAGGYAWKIEKIFFSHERFSRTVGEHTVAMEVGDILQAAGLPRPRRSSTDRVAGWTKMYSLLEADEWFVLKEECPTLCEAIPQLPRVQPGAGNIEDVEKPNTVSIYDDCGDACRYGIAGALLAEEPKPREVEYEERLAATTDPMRRFEMQYREYNRQLKEAQAPRKQVILPSWRARLQPKK